MHFFKDELTVHMYFIFNSLQNILKSQKWGIYGLSFLYLKGKLLEQMKNVFLNALYFKS